MDTISRENNSTMLPVGAIIVGVLALIVGGWAAITAAKVNKALADQQPKLEKIDSIEIAANSAAQAAERASRDIQSLQRSTQDVVTEISARMGDYAARITKIEESAKRPAAVAGKKGGEPVVAGPDEYVVRAGDTGMKIANANGVSVGQLQAVNPGVNWSGLKPGQKIKLPAKK